MLWFRGAVLEYIVGLTVVGKGVGKNFLAIA